MGCPRYACGVGDRHPGPLRLDVGRAGVASRSAADVCGVLYAPTDTLRDKRHRLDTLTAALQTSANSPEAKAKETEHQQRMDARDREPGWSLALNPTPALRAELGDAELARRAGHGGGSSDTRGLVGAGVGAGRGDLAAGQGSTPRRPDRSLPPTWRGGPSPNRR